MAPGLLRGKESEAACGEVSKLNGYVYLVMSKMGKITEIIKLYPQPILGLVSPADLKAVSGI